MNLAEYKRQNKDLFKKLKNNDSYIVYYANTETCTSEVYVNIIKSNVGYISTDNKGKKQNIIRAGTQKEALINHLFMNNDIYEIIDGIELEQNLVYEI